MVAGDVSLEVINNRVMAVSLTVRFQGSNSTHYVLAGGFGATCTELNCCLLGGNCFFSSRAFYMGEATRKMGEEN